MPTRGFTAYVIFTVASRPMGTGSPSATFSLNAFGSSENASALPSRSTLSMRRRAASSERSVSGARSDSNVTVATPAISSLTMSNRSSAL